MQMVQRLDYDKWVNTPVDDLSPGDVIIQNGKVVTVAGQPVLKGDCLIIPVRPQEETPICVYFDENSEREAITAVMNFVGAELIQYDDGTAMIANFEFGTEIYSPRLPIPDLEAFCMQHIDRYEDFFEKHQHQLDRGEVVPMERWW